ncbi:MAG: hypothetical protein GXY34_05890 [Syntrophomonadaceae bacterium]|nr:hypothetical protein [Syntrophomonadaceae bacterium]
MQRFELDIFDNESRIIPLFSSAIASFLAGIYFISRIGFEQSFLAPVIRTLLLSYFILFLPSALRVFRMYRGKTIRESWLYSDVLVFMSGLFLAGLCGFIKMTLNLDLLPVFLVLGLAFFIFGWAVYLKYCKLKLVLTWLILILIFSVWISSKVWARGSISSLFPESIIVSSNIDTLFHAAVAGNIQTYGIPSTGLDGIPLLKYHFGSHWLFAYLSNLLNISVYHFYSLAYQLIIVPFLFSSMLFFIINLKQIYKHNTNTMDAGKSFKSIVFWLVLMAGFIGIVPWRIMYDSGVFGDIIFFSESYCLGIAFFFDICALGISFFTSSKDKQLSVIEKSSFGLILLLMIVWLGLLQISIMVLLVVLVIYLILRLKLYKEFLPAMFLLTVAFLALVYIISFPVTSKMQFEMFAYIKTYVINNKRSCWVLGFLLINYFWSLALIITRLGQLKSSGFGIRAAIKKRETLDMEVILVLCMVGAVPGLIAELGAGNADYFNIHQFYVALCFVLALIPVSLESNQTKLIIRNIVIVIVACSVIYNTCLGSLTFLAQNIILRYDIMQSIADENKQEFNQSYIAFIKDKKIGTILTLSGEQRDILSVQLEQLINGPQKALEQSKRYELVEVLLTLGNESLAEKKNALLFIPQTNKLYWGDWIGLDNMPDMAEPLLAPALTGIAMIDGLPQHGKDVRPTYGYRCYSTRKTKQTSQDQGLDIVYSKVLKKGFSKLIIIDVVDGKPGIVRIGP